MTIGAVIFAQNNAIIDYAKIAIFAANRAKEFLDIPVSLITDNIKYLNDIYPDHPFDQVIEIPSETPTNKKFYDGTLSSKIVEWKNLSRNSVYDLTPYDRTLVLDSDYIINSNILKMALDTDSDFQIYRKSFDIAGWRDTSEFQRINCYSIPFYWATVFVFDKTPIIKSFFDLITYIKSNWFYFRVLYSIENGMYRNDIAFSIAIHLMNGKTNGEFVTELPGRMMYTIDKDILLDIKDRKMKFLVEKEKHLGEYMAAKVENTDVHIMNKSSLIRYIDGGFGV
jgi:hypothetical protein